MPISRWVMIALASGCRYSIGSSIVRMCSGRVWFTRSIRAAPVVLLPAPVGPVITTRPRSSSAQPSTVGGRPRVSVAGAEGIARKTKEAEPRWVNAATRKRPWAVK